MNIVAGYLIARRRVIEAGFGDDITWAEELAHVRHDAGYILREGAWVIINSGFRFQVARRLWPGLRDAFHDFDVARVDAACCTSTALTVLNHPGKIGAIIELAVELRREGPAPILAHAKTPMKLTRLPWIGRITCWHLAKVLGADVVKPDVHLQRAAAAAHMGATLELCEIIRAGTAHRLAVIDTILWRYGEQQRGRRWPGWDALWAG